MEKPVKYLLIFLLGLAVILGASGFSFIVHHCFTAEHIDVSTSGGHTENCCHYPDHTDYSEESSCCQEESSKEKQKHTTEISYKCCEEDLLAFRGLPLYNKTNVPELSAEVIAVISFISQFSIFSAEKPGVLSFFNPPLKLSGKVILLMHQVFLL